jgi:F0F1-type ATP synthase delta subunit
MKSIRDRFPQVTDIVFEVDESLIGGVEIVYKDYRYDGSLRGKFEQLKAKLDS